MSAFHQSPRWRALRLEAKRRDGWKCVECGARGRLEVDHVQPVSTRPDLALTLSNLRTLCRACHIAKTRAERGGPPPAAKAAWAGAVAELSTKPNLKWS